MMKNSEWGIVAYLSQSKYGKLGNENFIGTNKEIYMNKSNIYITGCSYGAPSNGSTDYGCQYQYNIDINGTGASTTGNIYGIYDMSGSAWEYVMGNYNDMAGISGFNNPLTLDSKYYDKYTSDNANTACNGSEYLSHGLSETAGWYNDQHYMISSEYPWVLRSGSHPAIDVAGIFLFDNDYHSGGNVFGSFRLVATIR